MDLPKTLREAVAQLTKIPGVGEKTALRQVLSLSSWEKEDLQIFSSAFKNLIDLKKCESCGLFSDDNLCEICQSDRVKSGIICVVESATDCLAIEKSETYFGSYYVLGGVLNPLLGVGPDELELGKLFNRIQSNSVKEVILAVNPSVEGDATCSYIRQQISDDIRVERIGFGIPMGGSLEYLDSMTISKALENRKKM